MVAAWPGELRGAVGWIWRWGGRTPGAAAGAPSASSGKRVVDLALYFHMVAEVNMNLVPLC